MRTRQISQLCAWSLGLILFCTTPACAQSPSSSVQPQQLSQPAILQELAKADVVYLGETHDRPEDHQAQLEIIQELYRQNRKVAIALEMFQRPYQGVVDRYLAGKITAAELVEQSEYNRRWAYPWEYYAPILQFAKQHQLPVLALNTPTEVTRKVAREGLESLTAKDQQYIPPISEIHTDNLEYRQMSQQAYELHHQAGQGNSKNFERFFTAQVLWDETMEDKIEQFLKTNPDYKVVVLAGQAHIVYIYGIPSRVSRRFTDRQVVQRSVLLSPPENISSDQKKAIADFVWQQVDQDPLN